MRTPRLFVSTLVLGAILLASLPGLAGDGPKKPGEPEINPDVLEQMMKLTLPVYARVPAYLERVRKGGLMTKAEIEQIYRTADGGPALKAFESLYDYVKDANPAFYTFLALVKAAHDGKGSIGGTGWELAKGEIGKQIYGEFVAEARKTVLQYYAIDKILEDPLVAPCLDSAAELQKHTDRIGKLLLRHKFDIKMEDKDFVIGLAGIKLRDPEKYRKLGEYLKRIEADHEGLIAALKIAGFDLDNLLKLHARRISQRASASAEDINLEDCGEGVWHKDKEDVYFFKPYPDRVAVTFQLPTPEQIRQVAQLVYDWEDGKWPNVGSKSVKHLMDVLRTRLAFYESILPGLPVRPPEMPRSGSLADYRVFVTRVAAALTRRYFHQRDATAAGATWAAWHQPTFPDLGIGKTSLCTPLAGGYHNTKEDCNAAVAVVVPLNLEFADLIPQLKALHADPPKFATLHLKVQPAAGVEARFWGGTHINKRAKFSRQPGLMESLAVHTDPAKSAPEGWTMPFKIGATGDGGIAERWHLELRRRPEHIQPTANETYTFHACVWVPFHMDSEPTKDEKTKRLLYRVRFTSRLWNYLDEAPLIALIHVSRREKKGGKWTEYKGIFGGGSGGANCLRVPAKRGPHALSRTGQVLTEAPAKPDFRLAIRTAKDGVPKGLVGGLQFVLDDFTIDKKGAYRYRVLHRCSFVRAMLR